MKTRVELDQAVADFIRSLAPGPRRKLRAALHELEQDRGDFLPLEGELTGYWRLRVGNYRVIVRFYMAGRQRVARCVFAERRSIVYALLAELLAGSDPPN